MHKPTLTERLARALAKRADLALVENLPRAVYPPVNPTYAAMLADDESPARQAARARFLEWRDVDPFPKIEPSLLNSADIDDYMRVTAMVHPYRPDMRKTASYPLRVGREIAYWDPNAPSDPPIKVLAPDAKVVIPSNSLIYVRTEEVFQLPNYMAVRFNLHIDLVHKGLLLGTGPLVDPGFSGRLMVPLHNLTSNTYVLQVGEDFIWTEFTKTSSLRRWTENSKHRPDRSGEPIAFEERKMNKSLADYVAGAKRGHRVLQPGYTHGRLQNAIPEKIREIETIAEAAKRGTVLAERRLARFQRIVQGVGVAAIIATLIATVTLYQSTSSSLQTTLGLVDATNGRVADQAQRIKELELRLSDLNNKVDAANSRVAAPQGKGPRGSPP
jgi:deoxycytidine triphosphate deaminase